MMGLLDGRKGVSQGYQTAPFHMLGIVSYQFAIVTLSLSLSIFQIFDLQNVMTLKFDSDGHSRSLKVIPFDRLGMVSY